MARIKPPSWDKQVELQRLAWKINEELGLPHMMLPAVAQKESKWDPRAMSDAGARGLTQLMPGTARELGLEKHEVYDPEASLRAGAEYLKKMLKMKGGDVKAALAAYNRGPYAKGPMPAETRKYVPEVMKFMKTMRDPAYLAPYKRPGKEYNDAPAATVVNEQMKTGPSLDEFLATTFKRPEPIGGLSQMVALKSTPELKTYTVRKGDNLSKIANELGVPLSTLVSRNRISNPDLIQIGQVLSY